MMMLLLVFPVLVRGQDKITREQYIDKYARLAMEEMQRAGIPASITLAQGCLESDNGNSRLARDAKNHFGIKCHDWDGRKIYHDDDEEKECFRKYRSEIDSYTDHTEFLTSKSRYGELFTLKQDDYKGWAKGLQQAGYATSPKYADLLIKIIEENELYRYDRMVLAQAPGPEPGTGSRPGGASEGRIMTNNRVEYIIVRKGDTPESLREEFDLYPGELMRYNNLARGFEPDSGMILYLQPKRRKAERGMKYHEVRAGESLWEISQAYGLKMKNLYAMNHLEEGSEVEAGVVLWLRKTKPYEEIAEGPDGQTAAREAAAADSLQKDGEKETPGTATPAGEGMDNQAVTLKGEVEQSPGPPPKESEAREPEQEGGRNPFRRFSQQGGDRPGANPDTLRTRERKKLFEPEEEEPEFRFEMDDF